MKKAEDMTDKDIIEELGETCEQLTEACEDLMKLVEELKEENTMLSDAFKDDDEIAEKLLYKHGRKHWKFYGMSERIQKKYKVGKNYEE